LPVREALAFRALQSRERPVAIVAPEPGAVIVAEIELGKVAVKVLLAAVLVHAGHAPLEDREHVLNRV
jgi:hypothetical protein